MRSAHVINTWSTTQATVALSSAEVELVAIVRAAAESIGVASLLRGMWHAGAAHVREDSSSSVGVCKRTGVNKVRHLDTCLLWVQDAVRRGALQVHDVPGEQNPADLMTKCVGHALLTAHLARLGVEAPRRPSRDRAPMRLVWRSCA